MSVSDFAIGNRVQLHPATDAWMMGDRFGQVVHIGKFLVHVLMDRSNKVRKLKPENIGEIVS